MKYVVDSSVAIKWFVVEALRPKEIRLRDDFQNGALELLAPDLFPTEIANVLLVIERAKRIAPRRCGHIAGASVEIVPVHSGGVSPGPNRRRGP